jgi:hypothetical protein
MSWAVKAVRSDVRPGSVGRTMDAAMENKRPCEPVGSSSPLTMTFLLVAEILRGVFNAFAGASRDNARLFAKLLAVLLFGLWLTGAFFIGRSLAPPG